MKFYMREPDKAIAGMAELTLEQRGAYNTIIDMLYARDGIVPDDDARLARCMRVNVQRWRRLKAELMAAGKIRITIDGLLDANGVETCRKLASSRSVSARKSATLRWENYRKANEINGTSMRVRNASISTSINYSSTSSNAGAEIPPVTEPAAAVVARTGSSGGSPQLSTTTALEASLRKKGWI